MKSNSTLSKLHFHSNKPVAIEKDFRSIVHPSNCTNKGTRSTIVTGCFLAALILSGCRSYKEYYTQERNLYNGTVFLKNGKKGKGRIGFPNAESSTVLFQAARSRRQIKTEDIRRLELYHPSAPDKVRTVQYMPIKYFWSKNKKLWVVREATGKYVSAYIGASGYKINSKGTLLLGSPSQQMINANGIVTTIPPSFPVYMIKKGEEKLSQVGLVEGKIINESGNFRGVVSRYLKDDPQLTEYIRKARWGYEHVEDIVKAYVPNRSPRQKLNLPPIPPLSNKLMTDDFTKDLILYLESAISPGHSSTIAIGIRYSCYRNILLGGSVGYASVKYGFEDMSGYFNGEYQITPDTKYPLMFKRESSATFNFYGGLQLPMDLHSFYLIPSASFNLGAYGGSKYSAFYLGPLIMSDIGFKLAYGSSLLVGLGFGYMSPLVGNATRLEGTFPGYNQYAPFNAMFLRIGYKY
ncbi:MAG: hypothetical protein LBH04_10880 [Tannerellaceae bacterium]|jgi:hypothetical protein|nr:hypothetical protein [Tannerellaceae bacterium]